MFQLNLFLALESFLAVIRPLGNSENGYIGTKHSPSTLFTVFMYNLPNQ
jgi:hypothetical protein